MTDWTELEHDGHRIRWRAEDRGFARDASRYELEYWHSGRREWRTVENWSSRDWFVLGIQAGKQMREGEQVELPI